MSINENAFILKVTVNKWKSYMWPADKEMNVEVIFAVMNTT